MRKMHIKLIEEYDLIFCLGTLVAGKCLVFNYLLPERMSQYLLTRNLFLIDQEIYIEF